jgi:hypothetical protein
MTSASSSSSLLEVATDAKRVCIRKSALKKRPVVSSLGMLLEEDKVEAYVPREVDARMADLESAEVPVKAGANVAGRREALVRYEAMERLEAERAGERELLALLRHWSDDNDVTDVKTKKKQVVLAKELRTREFRLDEAPEAVGRTGSEPSNTCEDDDHVAAFAAQLVDALHVMVSRGLVSSAEEARTRQLVPCLAKARRVLGEEAVTEAAFTEHALEQVRDLVERGEARLEHLAELVQPNVRSLAKQRSWAFEWTAEQEAGFVEAMASRRPDALVQRYLLKRPSLGVVGVDATPVSVAALRQTADIVQALHAAVAAAAGAAAAL